MRAILSVFDKTGIVGFAEGLAKLGYEIVSTGGTQTAIEAAGIPVTGISEITSFPEILDGRVKTLHPAVHAGILARQDVPEHVQTLRDHAIVPVDVVASNLYPFVATLESGADHDEIVENIDIGGPTLIRAAAKNADSVLVVVDSNDYAPVLRRPGGRADGCRSAHAARGQSIPAHGKLRYPHRTVLQRDHVTTYARASSSSAWRRLSARQVAHGDE